MVVFKILFKIVYQLHRLIEQFPVLTPVHEQRFRTEHFRNFRQNRRAFFADEQIGKLSDQRICRNAGKSVASAAFHADDEFRYADFFPLKTRCVGNQFIQQFSARLHLVFRFLADKEFHSVRIHFPDIRFQNIDIAVFASKSEHQYAAGIGMLNQIRQYGSRVLLVVAHLGTSIRMRKSNNFFYRPFQPFVRRFGERGGYIVHAANRRNYPDFISHPDLAIRPLIPHKYSVGCGLFFDRSRFIIVFQQVSERSLYIVRMYP